MSDIRVLELTEKENYLLTNKNERCICDYMLRRKSHFGRTIVLCPGFICKGKACNGQGRWHTGDKSGMCLNCEGR